MDLFFLSRTHHFRFKRAQELSELFRKNSLKNRNFATNNKKNIEKFLEIWKIINCNVNEISEF